MTVWPHHGITHCDCWNSTLETRAVLALYHVPIASEVFWRETWEVTWDLRHLVGTNIPIYTHISHDISHCVPFYLHIYKISYPMIISHYILNIFKYPNKFRINLDWLDILQFFQSMANLMSWKTGNQLLFGTSESQQEFALRIISQWFTMKIMMIFIFNHL